MDIIKESGIMKYISAIGKLLTGIIAIVDCLYSIFRNGSSIFSNLPKEISIVYLVTFMILGIFLIGSTIFDFYVRIKKFPKIHKFQYQSKKFFEFFANWYRQAGTLSIISGDLEWIQNKDNSNIYEALIQKARNKELNLLLEKKVPEKIIEELEIAGAKASTAPKNITANYTFSCIPVMNSSAGKIIVRDKYKNQMEDTKNIIFEEVSDIYVIDLLNALLNERVGI